MVSEVLEATPETKSIAVIVESNPAIVLLDMKSKDDLFNHIRSEIEAFEPDLTTAKGRDAIKSFAFKITRTKTAVDDAGKKLTEEWRTKTNAVNESRREVKQELTDMAASVRKPLTDWEEAEEARVSECREVIQWMKSAKSVFIEDTSDDVRERGKAVYETALTPEKYGDMLPEAESVKAESIESLKASLARLIKEESDRAELVRLQNAERERLAKEQADREAAEQRQREAEATARAEEQRIAAEKVEQERIANAERQAAESARIEAEQKAQRDRDAAEAERIAQEQKAEEERKRADAEKQRQHDEALATERQRALEAEQREAERLAKEQREEAERASREADQAHRTSVKTAAKEALIATGASSALATKIVLAILAGDIPSVHMEF